MSLCLQIWPSPSRKSKWIFPFYVFSLFQINRQRMNYDKKVNWMSERENNENSPYTLKFLRFQKTIIRYCLIYTVCHAFYIISNKNFGNSIWCCFYRLSHVAYNYGGCFVVPHPFCTIDLRFLIRLSSELYVGYSIYRLELKMFVTKTFCNDYGLVDPTGILDRRIRTHALR